MRSSNSCGSKTSLPSPMALDPFLKLFSRHWLVLASCCLLYGLPLAADDTSPGSSEELAHSVTIHRDAWGVPHILGPTDQSVLFGMGYAQAEDNRWQLEDTTIRALGRYAEVAGEAELGGDLLNRAFRVVERSRQDFEKLNPEFQGLIRSYTSGITWYLQHHPQAPLRLLTEWQPWMIVAIDRQMLLSFSYGHTHAGRPRELFGAIQPGRTEAGISQLEQAAQSFNGLFPSVSCAGVPGPLGVVYTVYSIPAIRFIRPARYAIVGSCYVSVVEFGERVQASSAVQFGSSGNPRSKHFANQTQLFSERKLKPAWFYPDDVLANAVRSYHPGE